MLDRKIFSFPNYDHQDIIYLWQATGFCLLQIQVFEHVIESYLTTVHKLDIKVARDEIEKIYDKYSKYTLGQLFKEIKNVTVLPNELASRIDNFINERNWLVHKCRKEHECDFYIKDRLNKILVRIDNLNKESVELGKYFAELSNEYIIKKGIMSEKELISKTQEILNSWGKA